MNKIFNSIIICFYTSLIMAQNNCPSQGQFIMIGEKIMIDEQLVDKSLNTKIPVFIKFYKNSIINAHVKENEPIDTIALTKMIEEKMYPTLMISYDPSRGGGAFLAINGGEKITAASMRAFLNRLKESYYGPIGPMIGKTLKHTFSKHGLHNTIILRNSAIKNGKTVGQWLDEIEAEKFIARHLSQLNNGVRDIPIPQSLQGIGRIFRGGDGSVLNPTHIRLVPSGSGVKTAYPINSSITPLTTLGTYIP